MKTSDNGGFLEHTYFFCQNSGFFHVPEAPASIIKVSRYERNNRKTSIPILMC
jgi:hypothetical protein